VLWLALRDGAQVAVFGALAGVPIAVVFAASLVPARRATCVDPAATIKTD